MALVPDINKASLNRKKVDQIQRNKKAKVVKPSSPGPDQDIVLPKSSARAKQKVVSDKNKAVSNSKKIFFGIFIAIIICVVLGAIGYLNGKTMYLEAIAGKDDFMGAQTAITEQRFLDAVDSLASAEVHFKNAQTASDKLFWIKWVPWVSTQFDAIDNLLFGGEKIASALQDISYVGNDIYSAIESDDTTISNITPKQRKAILEQVSKSPETLRRAQLELREAVEALDAIPEDGVMPLLAVVTIPIKEKLPLLDQIVEKAIPFLEIAPGLLGYPEPKTYLFLLQNNTELRPTGGFIGTYGILIMKNGDIKEFGTDNIYNLDSPMKDELFIDPPEPFAKYLGSTQWFMRDSNWHPDFTITAEKVEEFYHLENGPQENLDGVIAMTPVVIHDLLELTGPITVEGEEYTAVNLTEKLQYEVEVGYLLDGTSDSARKEVIGKIAGVLMERMLNLPKNQWGDLWEMAVKDLDQKHILIYSKDDTTQELVGKLGWDGAMHTGDEDYLMVVDANLAALKTDRVMTKNLDYKLTKEGSKYQVELTMKYNNDGIIGPFTTRYRTYTRIYVPYGSELIETTGFLTNDRYLQGQPVAAKVTQDEDLHKTVFEGFISVEPKTEETISIKYNLPDEITNQIESGNYSFIWQKQAGTDNVSYTYYFDIGKKIKNVDAIDDETEMSDNKVQFVGPLEVDKSINIELR